MVMPNVVPNIQDLVSPALGKFDPSQAAAMAQSPDAAAQRAYVEAQAKGAPDAFEVAKAAWSTTMQQHAQKFADPSYQPTDAGEANLHKIASYLQQARQMDPATALAFAHEVMPKLGGGNGGGGQGGGG